MVGILVFFFLERFLRWFHHHHDDEDGQRHDHNHADTNLPLVIIGDTVHNFIDGIVIAASFLVNPTLGIAATIAVVLHEIPQEIGQYAILIHGGWSKAKALWYNLLSGLTSVIGAVIVLVFAQNLEEPPTFLLAFAGASFIYIALSDLVPELHKEVGKRRSLIQFVWFIVGIALMGSLLFLE